MDRVRARALRLRAELGGRELALEDAARAASRGNCSKCGERGRVLFTLSSLTLIARRISLGQWRG